MTIKTLTNNFGAPVPDNQHSLTAGERGPDAVMTVDERSRLIANIAGHMRGVDPTVQARQVGHFRRANEEYGRRVGAALGLTA